jgi:hypothetical protein
MLGGKKSSLHEEEEEEALNSNSNELTDGLEVEQHTIVAV